MFSLSSLFASSLMSERAMLPHHMISSNTSSALGMEFVETNQFCGIPLRHTASGRATLPIHLHLYSALGPYSTEVSFNIRRTNMDFWAHEYNKHGRCSDNKFSQTQYFHEAHRLWLTYNAQYLFSQTTGIVPGYQYHYIDLESAIRQTIGGKTPLLMCKYDGRIAYLLDVVICFDYNAANPVDCVRTTNCGALVSYSL
ncbi:ribonuclease MC-like [Malus sylvestris]|uniref:ribonuclease MC-like n=1 Tax=Malus sylvestris TaxID=3752 RepID=UPI0021ABD4B9|nr:ribonuclease MC-like [Malus sylvestris]